MSAMMANFMSLPYNFKPAKFIFCVAPANVFVLNKMVHARLPNRLLKGLQFIAAAFGEQFYPAIGQIPHCAGQLESTGNRSDRIAKPDALHPTRVQNAHLFATDSTHPCQCATPGLFAGEKIISPPLWTDPKAT